MANTHWPKRIETRGPTWLLSILLCGRALKQTTRQMAAIGIAIGIPSVTCGSDVMLPSNEFDDRIRVSRIVGTIEPDSGFLRLPNSKLHFNCYWE